MAQFVVVIPDRIVEKFEAEQAEKFSHMIQRNISNDLRLNHGIDVEPQGRYITDFTVREIKRV